MLPTSNGKRRKICPSRDDPSGVPLLLNQIDVLLQQVKSLGAEPEILPGIHEFRTHYTNQQRAAAKGLGQPTFILKNSNTIPNSLLPLLSEIPKDEEAWRRKRAEHGVLEIGSMTKVIQTLTRRVRPVVGMNETAFRNGPQLDNPSQILASFCKSGSSFEAKGPLPQKLHTFGALLCGCLCVCSLELGLDVKDVNAQYNAYLGKNWTKYHLTRIRNVSVWFAKTIAITEESMSDLVWEGLLLSGLTMNAYRTIFDCKEKDDLGQYLAQHIKPYKSSAAREKRLPLSLPFLAAYCGFPLKTVNKALGTHLSSEHYESQVQVLESAFQGGLTASQPSFAGTASPTLEHRQVTPTSHEPSTSWNAVNPEVLTSANAFAPQPNKEASHDVFLLPPLHVALAGLERKAPPAPAVLQRLEHSSGQNAVPVHNESMITATAMVNLASMGHQKYKQPNDDILNDYGFEDLVDWDVEMDFVQRGCEANFRSLSAYPRLNKIVEQTRQLDLHGWPGGPLALEGLVKRGVRVNLDERGTSRLDVDELSFPPRLVDVFQNAINDEMIPQIRTWVSGPVEWTGMLVRLWSGALQPKESALVSLIVPIKWLEQDTNQRLQFDKGSKETVFASQEWPELVFLPRGCRIRKTQSGLVFYLVSFQRRISHAEVGWEDSFVPGARALR